MKQLVTLFLTIALMASCMIQAAYYGPYPPGYHGGGCGYGGCGSCGSCGYGPCCGGYAEPICPEYEGEICCDPCWDTCMGDIEVMGAPLYIRPSTCDLNFVITDDRDFAEAEDTSLPQGKENGICPDYEWAFRVGVGYVLCTTDVRVLYQRLCMRDQFRTETLENQAIWPTFGHPKNLKGPLINQNDIDAFATSSVRFEWNAVDGELASRQSRGCHLWGRGFVGLQWTQICFHRKAHYEGSARQFQDQLQVTDVCADGRTWGIGGRAGVDIRYEVACGFGVGAHAAFGLLGGEARHCIKETDQIGPREEPNTVEVLDVCHKSRCVVIPEVDVSLGINYLFCCGECFSLLVEFGYEFRSYVNALTHTVFNDDGATASEQCDNFNIDGFYLDFRLLF